jgi:amino acid transporter
MLAGGRLGTPGVLFFAVAAATPLPVVAAAVPAAYAGGLLVVPLGFLTVGLILLVFAAGHGAMVRRAPNAGALYAVVARGLGRPLGLGAAWVALLSYNALQIGLYGTVGAAAAPLLESRFGVAVPWWQIALACWAVVALLGIVRVEVVGWLLAVLVLAEAVVIAGFSAANVLDPAGGRIAVDTLLPGAVPDLPRPALGLLLVGAALAFVGFETTAAYSEEVRRPRRAIGRATSLAVLLLTLLYAGAAWALSVGTGRANLAATAADRGPELIFDLAAVRMSPWAVSLGRVLLLTGLIAAIVALHHTIARYLFALGRDRVLPAWLGRSARRTSAPRAASLTQSVIAGAVLAGCAYTGMDPQLALARRVGGSGGIGVLLLLTAAALAALLFLNRAPDGESAWRRFLAPGLSTVALGAVSYLALANLDHLLGVRPGDPLARIVPAAFAGAVLLGIGYGLVLRTARPVRYAGIGLGGTAVVISPSSPASPAASSSSAVPGEAVPGETVPGETVPEGTVPGARVPGAHRPERINRELSA